MDLISPSDFLMHGRIKPQPLFISNYGALKVAGINMVLALEDEEVASELKILGSFTAKNIKNKLVLYEVPDAWPVAVLLDNSAIKVNPKVFAGCDHGLLCRDLANYSPYRLPDYAKITKRPNNLTINVPTSGVDRLLLVTDIPTRMESQRWA